MLDWTANHSVTIDFLIAEVELVVVNGLGMYPFYTKLEKRFTETEDLFQGSTSRNIPLGQIKISGS